MKLNDLIGSRFGALLVRERVEDHVSPGGKRSPKWRCICDCGREKITHSSCLLNKATRSCGALECRRKMRQARNGNPARNHVLKVYKDSAKKRGYSWDIDDVVFFQLVQLKCWYCGADPSTTRKADGWEYTYNGLDRLDNTKGYSLSNIATCCKICNSAKNTMTVEAFKAWIEKVHAHLHR